MSHFHHKQYKLLGSVLPMPNLRSRLLILSAAAVIATCSLTANIYTWTFTSDDVAQQTIAYNLAQPSPHSILLENDTYVSKLPIYLVFNLIMRPGRGQLILESTLFNVIMLLLLFIWWRKSTETIGRSRLLWLWLLATGLFWMSQTINPNTRNVDIGLMLVYAACTLKTLESPPKNRQSFLRTGLLYSFLGGLLTYDDPYFLFFIVLPLFMSILIYYCAHKHYRRLVAAVGILIAGLGIYVCCGAIGNHFGLSISSKNELSSLSATITAPPELAGRALQIANAYLSLLGASSAYVHLQLLDWIRIIGNAGIIALGLFGLVVIIRKRAFSPINLWILITFLTVFVTLTVTGVYIYESARYLIVLLPMTALLAAITTEQLRKSRPAFYPWLLAFISITVLLNVTQALMHTYQNRHAVPQNQVSYQIAAAMEHNHIGAAYALYWQANITYYLSDYQANVLPAICSKGRFFQDPTLLDAQRFTLKTSRIGFIVSPQFRLPTENSLVNAPYGQFAPSCTVKSSIEQFGRPQKIVHVNATTDLLVYPHGLNKNDDANHRRATVTTRD